MTMALSAAPSSERPRQQIQQRRARQHAEGHGQDPGDGVREGETVKQKNVANKVR
jgi:hypothetical protein